jgi:hypothetical protein
MTWRYAYADNVRAYPVRPKQPFGSAARYEAKIWHELVLCHSTNWVTRRVPEWVSDQEIAATLRAIRAAIILPWEIPDDLWEQISCPPNSKQNR